MARSALLSDDHLAHRQCRQQPTVSYKSHDKVSKRPPLDVRVLLVQLTQPTRASLDSLNTVECDTGNILHFGAPLSALTRSIC